MISSLLFSTLIAFGALSPIPARASTTGILDRHPQQAHSNPDRLKPDVKKPDVKKPDVKKPDHIKTNPINLLVNGDFRRRFQNMPAEWGGHEGLSSKPRDAAHPHCLRTSLPFSQDGYASQYLPLDGQRIRQVRFAVSAAWQNVRQGRDENNTCRATLLFFDAHGGVIGEFVDLGHWTGTSKGWQRYSHLFEVPAHTRRIQITLGLNGCSGTAWFSDARLEVTRGDLTYHTPPYSRTNTKGWMVWEDPSQSNAQSNEPPRNTRNTQKKGQKQTSNTHEYPIPPIPTKTQPRATPSAVQASRRTVRTT